MPKIISAPPLIATALIIALIAAARAMDSQAPKPHPSELAAMKCINQIAPIFATRERDGKDVECDIPVSLSENDLDTLLKEAVNAATQNEKWRSYAKKYSGVITKAVTNFRAAECKMKIRVKRADIINALERDKYVLEMGDQPVNCQALTRKRETKPLSFAFTPRIETENGCIKKFDLNMGKIDAGCRICFINRLYITTSLLALWANRAASNIRRELNRALAANTGAVCK
jgi:hypothetical protein